MPHTESSRAYNNFLAHSLSELVDNPAWYCGIVLQI
jgi:hypothetical protein